MQHLIGFELHFHPLEGVDPAEPAQPENSSPLLLSLVPPVQVALGASTEPETCFCKCG